MTRLITAERESAELERAEERERERELYVAMETELRAIQQQFRLLKVRPQGPVVEPASGREGPVGAQARRLRVVRVFFVVLAPETACARAGGVQARGRLRAFRVFFCGVGGELGGCRREMEIELKLTAKTVVEWEMSFLFGAARRRTPLLLPRLFYSFFRIDWLRCRESQTSRRPHAHDAEGNHPGQDEEIRKRKAGFAGAIRCDLGG